jgi:hypothetical protein
MPSTTLPDVTSQEQLNPLLERILPDTRVIKRGKMTVVARNDWQTASVNVNKKGKVTVGPWPLGTGMASLWSLLIMITGVGLVIWAVVVLPKHQELAKQVLEALERSKQSQ